MSRWSVMAWLAVFALVCGAEELPEEAEVLRETFRQRLGEIENTRSAEVAVLGDEYLAELEQLEDRMQAAGRVGGLVAVHDERLRFAEDRTFAKNAPAEELDLAHVQERYGELYDALSRSNEMAVVSLAGDYLKALYGLKAKWQLEGQAEGIRQLDGERDRLLGLARLRRALKATRSAAVAAPAITGLAEDTPGTVRSLKMYRLSNEDVTTVLGYEVEVDLVEDASSLRVKRSESAGSVSESADGKVSYVPRVALVCRNAAIAAGSRLVIDYFSRSLTEGDRKREDTEIVPLPAVARGETYRVDAAGIQLYRSESTSTGARGVRRQGGRSAWGAHGGGSSARTYSGSEFFGLVASVIGPDGQVLFQRFTPQSLEKEIKASSDDSID